MNTGPRVAVIGAGPAGLYTAWSIRRLMPGAHVTVWEQQASGDSGGFGVVFSRSALDGIALRDPDLVWQIEAAGEAFTSIHLRMGDAHESQPVPGFIAVARSRLLEMLRHRCDRGGVTLNLGKPAPPPVRLSAATDVVVIAGGLGSQSRDSLADRFGTRSSEVGTPYAWLGSDRHFEGLTFAVHESPHGMFVVHAYPYAPNRSTFIIEIGGPDPVAAGVSVPGVPGTPSTAALERVLAGTLRGGRLLADRSRWRRFHSVSNDIWWTDNIVLVGDAAHTTHYSIGSGTKLAMDDAAVLAEALAGEDSVQRAFAGYEAARRPVVENAQTVAERSRRWFADIADVLAESPAEVLRSLATRGGSVRSRDLRLGPGLLRPASLMNST
jgi:2-polyprenyl-6-methoxyphenol hydroxylase-like FAD-dependent oxidoreductase